MQYHPTALEGIDDRLVDDMTAIGLHPQDVKLLPDGGGWLLVEFGGETREDANSQARRAMEALKKQPDLPSMKLFDDPKQERIIWRVRESGLGATAHVPNKKITWEGWEDSAVPPEKLGGYLRDLRALFEKYHYECDLYGHFGQGCVHTRIDFDLETVDGIKTYRAFLREALHLCLSCKGCKGDCPVSVDMATYKSEFMSHYFEGRLRPRQAYIYGLIDRWSRWASKMPSLINFFTQTPVLRDVAKALVGMPSARQFPQFAPQTFTQLFASRASRNADKPPVTLWPDTFNNHYYPETLVAACEVLEAAGFQVCVPAQSLCCGMAGSFGFEKDKYEVSIQCSERVLLPMVRHASPETLIIADGFSCREQIAQTTNRRALHLAQVIQMAIRQAYEK